MTLEAIGGGLYLAPSTADLWREVGSPALYNSYSAWRSRAMQQHLHDLWLTGKGNFAAAPGNSNHEKGAAFDAINQSAAFQARCRAVGLIRDSSEPWHWNDPNWRSMPIIPTLTSAAGGDAQILTTPTKRKDNDNMILIRVTHPTNDYTEALITDGIYSKTVTPVEAREYMYIRPDLNHNADGGRGQFDTVCVQGVYDKFKALPSFPA